MHSDFFQEQVDSGLLIAHTILGKLGCQNNFHLSNQGILKGEVLLYR
jgi:hypothetical protein